MGLKERIQFNLKLGDDIVDTKSFIIAESNGFYTHRTSIKASSSGMKRIRASISLFQVKSEGK